MSEAAKNAKCQQTSHSSGKNGASGAKRRNGTSSAHSKKTCAKSASKQIPKDWDQVT